MEVYTPKDLASQRIFSQLTVEAFSCVGSPIWRTTPSH
jgi:hypothetical protein